MSEDGHTVPVFSTVRTATRRQRLQRHCRRPLWVQLQGPRPTGVFFDHRHHDEEPATDTQHRCSIRLV